MKKIIYILATLSIHSVNAQIGINTQNLQATVHVKSISTTLPVLKIDTPTTTPILEVYNDKTIGVNTVNDGSATLIIDSKDKGNSGVRISNHQNGQRQNNLMDLAVTTDGIVVSRGKNIGNTFFAFKTTDSPLLNASDGIITDQELIITLPKGVYQITGSVLFFSGTNNDIELFLEGVGEVTGKFNAIGQYGSFTNEVTAVPHYEQNINSTNGVAVGGGGTGDDNKSGAHINGYIQVIGSSAIIKLKYKQQAGVGILARDTKIFKNTYIKATKIQ